MEFFADYGLFLAKTVTLVVALVFVVVVIAANAARKGTEAKPKGHLTIENINEHLEDMKADLQHALLNEETFKAEEKAAKKKAKVMFVPKGATPAVNPRLAKKTFKAKRVRLTIDNTAKTHKRRQLLMIKIDSMTDDQLRAAAVAAKLSRRETVAKVPVPLLRQMLKDYQTMRGMLL